MAGLILQDITKSFGSVDVIKGVNLDVKDGEFCVFVGPSGCGKSTLLRMIAGLESPTSGEMTIGGRDVTWLAPAERGISMVFQSYALYPHMSVADNIGFGLRMAGLSKSEIKLRTAKAAELLQLTPLLNRRPGQLSGGQRQRVAIGRAIVREPEVFLFDEPLSNLDAALRVQMRIEITKLHQDLRATMIYVTHDQVEAMTMADRIVVLNAGKIEQVGTPLELYHRPRNLFVATFIGSPKMNLIPGKITEVSDGKGSIELTGEGKLVLPTRSSALQAGAVTLGIRPEHLLIAKSGESSNLSGRVILTEHLGSETMLYVQTPSNLTLLIKTDGLAPQRIGDDVALRLTPEACHVFDGAGETVLSGSLI